MEETKKSNAGQGLGIAGFILGIVALVISFIPCLGMFAIYPGIIAVILSAIAFSQANKVGGSKGLIIAALIVSIIGTAIAGWQFYVIKYAAKNQIEKGLEGWKDELKNAFDELEEEGVIDDMEDALDELEDAVDEAVDEAKEAVEEAKEEIEEAAEDDSEDEE
ncbi:MAG: hypothetical protein KAT68_14080 [Bacteroidales bacterium]|nr:hypothetical protein [Bacteroidales bacterium]